MMPRDQEDQTDRNPDMIANIEGKKHCVDFVLMMDVRKKLPNGKIQGMTLPDKQTFEDCVGDAINLIVSENLGWCNVVEDTWFNRHQIGVIVLNYGYPDGANRFRDAIHHKSTSEVIYNLYPGADMSVSYTHLTLPTTPYV